MGRLTISSEVTKASDLLLTVCITLMGLDAQIVSSAKTGKGNLRFIFFATRLWMMVIFWLQRVSRNMRLMKFTLITKSWAQLGARLPQSMKSGTRLTFTSSSWSHLSSSRAPTSRFLAASWASLSSVLALTLQHWLSLFSSSLATR